MKLYYDKRLKDPTYYIQEGYRDNKGKATTRNVCKIGKHSELLNITDDPYNYALEEVRKMNKEKVGDVKTITFNIDFTKKLDKTNELVSKSLVKNIGYFYLENIYDKLNINRFIDNITRTRKTTFNSNDVNRFLTFSRILSPMSKLSTYDRLDTYFEETNFDYHHILRFMDILSSNYDKYLKHLFNESNNIHKRDTSICYYDCTNFYFEIDEDDENYVDEYTGELIEGLRKHGISKEHRNTPIVEMGLFMDKDGIPITMGLFPGNTNEQVTVNDLEIEMIKSFKDKRLIYCADAGLGSSSIRLLNDMPDKKFIVTQSIKKMSEELIQEVLKDEGFKFLSNNKDYTIKDFKNYNFDILKDSTKTIDEKKEYKDLYDDRLYKVIDIESNIDLGLYNLVELKNGKMVKRKSKDKLKQRIIITFSRKTMEYQRKIRNIQIEKAKNRIKNKDFDFKKNPNDYTRFIKSEKAKEEIKYFLDEELIKKEEKFDGFYALATNLLYDDVKEILKINSERYMIEDCFRVLKTNFNARPVYHRLDKRLKAHFLICYTALLIYKLLDVKLNEDLENEHYTINNILDTLKSMNLSNQNDEYYSSEYTNSKTLERLEKVFDLGLNKKYYSASGIKKIIKKIS